MLRQLIPSAAIDQIQAALHLVRGANRTALDFYLSALEFQDRARSATERRLVRRIEQCRGLMRAGF